MSQRTEQEKWLLEQQERSETGPVTCLGKTFANEEERRSYFTEELRRKLPELKKLEGFPIAEDEDILALSDPPYYTACPNPWLHEIVAEWEKERREQYGEEEAYQREPFAADVSEGKNDPIYHAHSYHTKVPHKAIMRYLLHYTRPGDIVFDGFAGTGMTGVAAQLCGDRREVESLGYKVSEDGTILDEEGRPFSRLGARKAILNDLSPAASFIAYNYNTPVDVAAFEQEARRILAEVEAECGWMYETRHVDEKGNPQVDLNGNPIVGRINYTVWSDVFVCPSCLNEIVFWDAAVDQEAGKVRDRFHCPACGAEHTKRSVERAWETRYDAAIGEMVRQAKQVPVLINYSVGNRRYEKRPDADDLALIAKIEEMEIPYWFPTDRMPDGYNTEQPKNSHGVTHVHHFYTKRNLWVLSTIFYYVRNDFLLRYTFTGIIQGLTKLQRFKPKTTFPNMILSGTLYIGSLVREWNVIDWLSGKIRGLNRGRLKFSGSLNCILLGVQSASSINAQESSIDYIFTDPPFGSNLMYSELNFLWEAWLKVFTNNQCEAIVNKTQGKGLMEYQRLMEACFREYYRVLKPGRWMTVEFSNSQASVWNAIQEAIQRAGFVIANVSILDKQQGSFKAVTTTTAVRQDLVISAYKPSSEMRERMQHHQNSVESAWIFVREHLEKLPVFIGKQGEAQVIVERTPRILFDRMVAYHVQNGLPVPISSAEFQEGVAQRFPMRDGMVFLETQLAEYEQKRMTAKELIQQSLFVTDENSAIEWLRQQLLKKPQTRQELHPEFMKQIQHIAKYELLPELDQLLEQNFLKYEGDGPVPDQILSYLRRNYKDLRGLDPADPKVMQKARERWYVPDPNKQADLEKLREKSLLREFEQYKAELANSRKRLKQFRTEAIRAGFKRAWSEKDYETIVLVGDRLPESVLQEDDKLLMYYDNAQIRLGR
ncbi:DNA methyltransferase [Bacillaceae bacterium]